MGSAEETSTICSDPETIYASLPVKQRALAVLRDGGVKQTEAARALGITRTWASLSEAKLKKYGILGNTRRLKAASQSLDLLLAGRPVGECKTVKDSTVLGAIQMVYDRVQPAVRQTTNLHVSVDIGTIDYGRYMEAYRDADPL